MLHTSDFEFLSFMMILTFIYYSFKLECTCSGSTGHDAAVPRSINVLVFCCWVWASYFSVIDLICYSTNVLFVVLDIY